MLKESSIAFRIWAYVGKCSANWKIIFIQKCIILQLINKLPSFMEPAFTQANY